MVMFRCGVLPLREETGRYQGEPLKDRMIAVLWKTTKLKQRNILLYCSLYENIRNYLFGGKKTLLLITTRNVAKSIYQAYKMRQSKKHSKST
jgi:hypothetical protein